MSSEHAEAIALTGARGGAARWVSVVVPLFVVFATASVIAWSAWPLVRPARQVRVAQAVFDHSSAAKVSPASTDTSANVPTVQAAGWLEAEPFYVACTALADGVVEQINVLEGEYVEQGEVVARLVDEDSRLRLRRAEAQLANARAQLASAEAEAVAASELWDEPVALERAADANRAALAEAEAELARLPSLVESAVATLVRFAEEYDRFKGLRSRSATTDFEVVIARQRVAAQRAEVEALKQREPVLKARIDQLAANLRAAQRDLKLRTVDRRRLDAAKASVAAAEAAVQHAEAERDEAKLELERMVIRAPISGYVQRRLKAPGDKVVRMMDSPHSMHLVHLYDPSKLQVRVDVPLADASHVYEGQACEVVVEVLPDRVFRGKVLRSTHEADLQKNTLQFKVKVLDPAPILRPEMLTRVKFLPPDGGVGAASAAASNSPRVLLPEAALDRRGGQLRVWVVAERHAGRGRLQPTTVQTVAQRDDWVLVAGDLQPGDLVTLDFAEAVAGEAVVIRREVAGGDV